MLTVKKREQFKHYRNASPRRPTVIILLGDDSYWQLDVHSAAAAAAKSLQSCPTLCDPTDGSPPGSAVPGIFQARTLEWVAISFSNAWKWKVKSESEVVQSCPTLSDPMDYSLPGSSVHGIFQARVMVWGAIAFSEMHVLRRPKKMIVWAAVAGLIFTKCSLPVRQCVRCCMQTIHFNFTTTPTRWEFLS